MSTSLWSSILLFSDVALVLRIENQFSCPKHDDGTGVTHLYFAVCVRVATAGFSWRLEDSLFPEWSGQEETGMPH